MSEPAGPAIYFDGHTAARRAVTLRCGPQLEILDADGRLVRNWRWDRVHRVRGSRAVMRLSFDDGPSLSRIEVRDPLLAEAIRSHAPDLDARGAGDASDTRRLVALVGAAAVSLAVIGVFGIPAVADRLAPVLPWSWDERIGAAIDPQVRQMLVRRTVDDPVCGAGPGEAAGRAALEEMTARLAAAAELPVDLKVAVLRADTPNAVALPGGYIYLLDGLIRRAGGPDEVAGVMAHEIGHVAARDGTRKLLQTAGMSFLFGVVLGDFAGGGAIVVGTRALTESAYSREAESRADAFAVGIMNRLGGDPGGLGRLLARISKSDKENSRVLDFLSSHPLTPDRIRAIEAARRPGSVRPILDDAAWQALRTICGSPS